MNTQLNTPAPETKMGQSGDIATAFDDFMHAFDSFKEANDERLEQIEKRMTSDVITDEKMERIMVLKNYRPSLGGASYSVAQVEHKSGFESYIRSGDEHGLRMLEEKAMSSGSDPDGGFLVPEELSNEIGKRLASVSPIRSIASVRQVSASVFKKPFAATGPNVGWVGETDVRPQTATPSLSELQFPTMELYAMPAATSSLLEDSAIDLDAWIAEEVEMAFAEQEGAAFVNGDGINQPAGFLSSPVVSDVLIDTVYALKAGYRQNANFVMNRKTQAELRKLKDGDGNYLWQAPAGAGQQAMLMGFPVVEAEDMPDMGSDTTPIAFGDFRRGYLVVDRAGVRVLRDPYSAKPYVLFYTTKRVGGGVQDFDAIKLIKFGTA